MNDPAQTGPCSLGPCVACGRPFSDHSPEALPTIGLGPEFVCGACRDWTHEVTRWFLVKTRRMRPNPTLRFFGIEDAEPFERATV